MAFVQTKLSDLGIPLEARQNALLRALADPGIPSRVSTESFWLKDPHPTLHKMQSTTLPERAEVVIIGSGITGTSVAKTLLEHIKHPQGNSSNEPLVVLLEAREICSGATGRNGGHILETADDFADFERSYGTEAAKDLIRFRLAHLKEMLSVAEDLDIADECQARQVEFTMACFDDLTWVETVKRVQRLQEALAEETSGWQMIDDRTALKSLHLSTARGVVTGAAGALWPYKFVTSVLDKLKSAHQDDLRIETQTPVLDIRTINDRDGVQNFVVHTSRGTIRAKHVMHCTNAHVGHLVPGLRGAVYPIRGQMSAQQPGESFPHQGKERSWLFVYDRGFDYLTQLPHDKSSDGEMMFGGGFAQSAGGGLADIGIAQDDKQSLYADIHLSGALGAIFGRDSWGPVQGHSVKQMWTGNMGFSADNLPFVGPLTSKMTGRTSSAHLDKTSAGHGCEWVAAAYSGEGMVNAWLCGKAVALMLMRRDQDSVWTRAEEPSWLPEQMLISDDRVERSRLPEQILC